jgi:rare lipoprotein A
MRSVFRATGNARHVQLLLLGLLIAAMAFTGCSRRVPSSTPHPPPPSPEESRATRPKPYKVLGKWYQPLSNSRGYYEKGIASWYGKKFHGRKTANGETYNMYGLSAAHKTLPLGTWVRVKNLRNGATMDLRINDRGPFVRGRIIDLSYGAAKRLGVAGPGTAPVELFALGRPAPEAARQTDDPPAYQPLDYYSGNFTFQVGAFLEQRNARRLRAKLDPIYKNAHITTLDTGQERFYQVRVGRCKTLEEARRYKEMLILNGYPDVFTVAE